MSSVEIPLYVPSLNLPAPVTTGTTVQSFTDVLGDVWVAKNGVNSGAWKRAINALHAKYQRVAAYNFTTTTAVLPYDTLMMDDYGIYSLSTGYWTAPINGIWHVRGVTAASSTAAGQAVTMYVRNSGGGIICATQVILATVNTASCYADWTGWLNAGDQWAIAIIGGATMAGSAGQAWATLTIDYVGTR